MDLSSYRTHLVFHLLKTAITSLGICRSSQSPASPNSTDRSRYTRGTIWISSWSQIDTAFVDWFLLRTAL
ncbi:hypothetical protein B0H17DRAFT_1082071, partial [Mycena rosella]